MSKGNFATNKTYSLNRNSLYLFLRFKGLKYTTKVIMYAAKNQALRYFLSL